MSKTAHLQWQIIQKSKEESLALAASKTKDKIHPSRLHAHFNTETSKSVFVAPSVLFYLVPTDIDTCACKLPPPDRQSLIQAACSNFASVWNVKMIHRKFAILASLFVITMGFPASVRGQVPPEQIHPPQVVKNVQLNAISGSNQTQGIAPFEQSTDVSIGGSNDSSKLSLVRTYSEPNVWGDYYRSFGVNYSHNFDFRMYCHYDDFGSYVCTDFSTPMGSVAFDGSGYHDGNLLDTIGGGEAIQFKLWTKSGALVEFDYPNSMLKASCAAPDCFMAKSVSFPNGEKISFEYERAFGSETIYAARLLKAVSNRGYLMRFYYESPATASLYGKALYVSKVETIKLVCASNLCVERIVASVSYQYRYTSPNSIGNVLGVLTGFKDSNQGLTSYEYNPDSTGYQGRLIAVKRPANPGVAVYQNIFSTGAGSSVITQTNALGVVSTFTHNYVGPGQNTVVEQQGSRATTYTIFGVTSVAGPFGFVNWTVKSITRPGGLTTIYNYDEYGRVVGMIEPEGNSISWDLDIIGNITKETITTKSGFVGSPIITQWNYLPCGANLQLCHRINYKIDPKGGRTDYTWNSRGELEKIQYPADDAGIRPQQDYLYTAYNGIDGNSIYLVSSIVTRVDATYSTTTSFVYDSTTGFSLKETVVDGVLRTCFRTDDAGNVISETTPRSGVCP